MDMDKLLADSDRLSERIGGILRALDRKAEAWGHRGADSPVQPRRAAVAPSFWRRARYGNPAPKNRR